MGETMQVHAARQDASFIEAALPTDAARLRRLADLFERVDGMMKDVTVVRERLTRRL